MCISAHQQRKNTVEGSSQIIPRTFSGKKYILKRIIISGFIEVIRCLVVTATLVMMFAMIFFPLQRLKILTRKIKPESHLG